MGAGHRNHDGGVGGEDVVVAGKRVVFFVCPALEPAVENAAAVLIAFAEDEAPAVDVVVFVARPVLPERRRHLVAVSIGKRSSQDRGPRAVDLQGDGLGAVRLVRPVGHLSLTWLGAD